MMKYYTIVQQRCPTNVQQIQSNCGEQVSTVSMEHEFDNYNCVYASFIYMYIVYLHIQCAVSRSVAN